MGRGLWVINEKGGTGKTTVAAPLVDHLIATGTPCRFVDADCQPDQKDRASLSAIFPGAERLDIGVSPDALMAKPSLAIAHWDGLFEKLRGGADMLVDFGANVSASLLYWMEESEVGMRLARAGIRLDLVLVTTAHPDAVGDAVALVRRLRAAIPAESRRIFVILNQGAGDFDSYAESAEMSEFRALDDSGEMSFVVVPKCGSEIWRDVERHRITALAAARMPVEELQARLKTPELETARGRKALARWHQAVVEAFIDGGLFPDDRRSENG